MICRETRLEQEFRRSYVGAMLRFVTALVLVFLTSLPVLAKPVTILVLGDSLTAGLGLPPEQAFPVKLELALKPKYPDLTIMNAGVSGDTAADGLARLDWALTPEMNAVIIELGANDALRGLDPSLTEKSLDQIITAVKAKGLPVLLAGMRAPPNLGPDYGAKYDSLFDRLAEKHDVLLYPFFLEGVAAQPELNQPDGIHPNAQGVDRIVASIAPVVEKLIGKVQEN
jgi:acyl-CoA thioesterase-1